MFVNVILKDADVKKLKTSFGIHILTKFHCSLEKLFNLNKFKTVRTNFLGPPLC